MAKCYYIITNSKSGESFSIPAFDLLTTEDFVKAIPSLKGKDLSNVTLTTEEAQDLEEFLKKHLHHQTVKSLINEVGVFNFNSLTDQVNEKIQEGFSGENLWKAVKNYFDTKKSDRSVMEGTKGPSNIDDLIKTLSINTSKVESKIFSKWAPEIVTLADISLNSEISEIDKEIEALVGESKPATYFEDLRYFLNITNDFLDWKNANTIIKISNNRLKEESWNWGNRLAYSDTVDKRHLVIGLFKRLASNISHDKLVDIFKDWNSVMTSKENQKYQIDFDNITVEQFFMGSFTDKDVEIPIFDTLLPLLDTKVIKIKKQIDIVFDALYSEISNLIAEKRKVTESTKNKYRTSIENIVSRVFPQIATTARAQELVDESIYEEESKEFSKQLLHPRLEQVYNLSQTVDSDGKNLLGEKFTRSVMLNPNQPMKGRQTLEIEELYPYLMNNITINRDLIRMPDSGSQKNKTEAEKRNLAKKRERWAYWTVTSIYPPKGKDNKNGVRVYGSRINSEGKYETTNYNFTNETPLEFRKYSEFSNTSEGERAVDGQNATTVALQSDITFEFAKNFLSPGDIVGNHIIISMHPGYMLMSTIGDTKGTIKEYKKLYGSEFSEGVADKTYKNIIVSKKLYQMEQDKTYPMRPSSKTTFIRSNTRSASNSNVAQMVAEGDYVQDKNNPDFYDKVMYSDKTNVYVFVPKKEGGRILKALPRTDIKAAVVSVLSNSSDVTDILDFMNRVKDPVPTLSSFVDPVVVKQGDFLIHTLENGKELYGMITDKENDQALLWNGSTWDRSTYLGLDNVVFYSKDNRLEGDTKYSLMANVLNIQMLPLNHKQLNMTSMAYITDSDLELGAVIPGTKYTENGKYISSNYLSDSHVNRTEEVIKLLGGNPKKDGLFVKTIGAARYERNYDAARLHPIYGINSLSNDFIRNKMLFKGVYFNVFNGSTINNTLYYISRVSGDDVYARRYIKNENGDILLEETKFDANILLDFSVDATGSHVPGSIAQYYIQKGNSKFSEIINEIKQNTKDTKQERETYKQERDKLNSSLKTFFDSINVKVITTNSESEFQQGQKAKLVTMVGEKDIKGKLIIKSDLGTRTDLVHEVLHLFLGALKFSSIEDYYKMINSVKGQKQEWTLLQQEEYFISKVQDSMTELDDSFFDTDLDLESFIQGLNKVRESINPLTLKEGVNANIVEILQTPIVKFMGMEVKNTSHFMANANLAQLTPAFLRWLDDNNFQIMC